jgi:acyl-CoA thioester hydrolase
MSTGATKPFEVNLDFPVQTYDIDFAGVVSNIVYIRWLEDLRLAILAACYPLHLLLDAGLAPTLFETRIRYQQPITIRDRASGRMWVPKITRIKLIFEGEIYANGEVAATSIQTGCLIDQSSGRPAPIPGALRSKFEMEKSRG